MNTLTVNIKAYERGFVYENGGFVKMLEPGNHWKTPFRKQDIIIVSTREPFDLCEIELKEIQENEAVLKSLHIVDIKDGELAFHYEDGHFKEILNQGVYAFWKVEKDHKFDIIDCSVPDVSETIDKAILMKKGIYGHCKYFDVEAHEKGILFYDKVYQRTLEPGRYFFWINDTDVSVQKVDIRAREIEVMGQEILTEDKVPIRINFFCQYKITDVLKPALEIKDYEKQMYIYMQLVIRSYVASMKLDDLLQEKEKLAKVVLEVLETKEEEFGAKFIYTGVKDMILPGEIRDIMNTVLIAEKRAKANVITRREETASTRSLLNTAKLMDENKTLYRLKELEYLERICERVGNISLGGGQGLLEQLNELVMKK